MEQVYYIVKDGRKGLEPLKNGIVTVDGRREKMRVRDLIEELIQLEKDYGNLTINHGVELNIDVKNNNLNIDR